MDRKRVFISGTGRAGTTFLIQLLTEIGLDTGFRGDETTGVYWDEARAGFEWDIFDRNGPAIIKSPYLCDRLDDVLAAAIGIAHIIIPVRDFAQAAASRRHVQRETTGCCNGDSVAGGLWGTHSADEQEAVLRLKFTALVTAAVRNDVPMTFLSFPRFVGDSGYLYRKLGFLLEGVDRDQFETAFKIVARPDLVHEFQKSAH